MILLSCAACRSDIYEWGRYQDSLRDMYLRPGKLDPADEVARLSEQIEITLQNGRRVPPGLHAHLGYLYLLAGNRSAGTAELLAEKATFPESAVFIDGMLKRMAK